MNVVRWESIVNFLQERAHRRVDARFARIEDLHCALDAVDRLVRLAIRPAHGDQLRHGFAPRKCVPGRVDLHIRCHGARTGLSTDLRNHLNATQTSVFDHIGHVRHGVDVIAGERTLNASVIHVP